MVQCVIGSNLHGGPIELILIPASTQRLVVTKAVVCVMQLWDGAYKRTLAANWKD